MLRHSLFFGKRHPYAEFSFLSSWKRRRGGRPEATDTFLGSLESKVSLNGIRQWNLLGSFSDEQKALSSVVVYVLSQPSIVLTFIGGVEIGDGMEGPGD